LLAAAVLLAGLLRSCEPALWPTRSTLVARAATAELLGDSAVLCGPYAPVLCQGTGRTRRLGYRLRTDTTPEGEDLLPAGLTWAREAGITHIALSVAQERSAQLVHHCARLGVALEVVALLHVGGPPDHDLRRRRVRGARVLLLRFPWAQTQGYTLSAAEAGALPRSPAALLARAAGLCARGDAGLAWRWLQACPPQLRGELQATLRRTERSF
ncbi:MAG: hypothetical protein KDD82_26425, partial [Planctomycetes bacterium]|nr:hypothetical protein [Planctomycetota bacterium]